MKRFLFFGICSIAFSLSAQVNCASYSQAILDLIVKKDSYKVNNYIRPTEHSLRIMHWESTTENIALIDEMNQVIEDTVVASIFKIHEEFKSKGVPLKKAKFNRCEFDRDKDELYIYFNYDKSEYWIKAFTDLRYLEDRFKSQFDTTLTMHEKSNARITRTESKPLEPVILSAKKFEILTSCYSESDVEQYGNLEDLLVILESTLDSGIIEIVSMCNSDKCRGKLVIFHLNLDEETCKIVLE